MGFISIYFEVLKFKNSMNFYKILTNQNLKWLILNDRKKLHKTLLYENLRDIMTSYVKLSYTRQVT